jgi:hypothetical protein
MEISLTRSEGESNHLGVSISRFRLAARCATRPTSGDHSGYKRPLRDVATNAVRRSARMDAFRAGLGAVHYGNHRGGVALWHRAAARWPAPEIAGGSRRPHLRGGSGGSRVAFRQRRSTRVRRPCREPASRWAADCRSRRPHRRHRSVAWRRSGHPKYRRFCGLRVGVDRSLGLSPHRPPFLSICRNVGRLQKCASSPAAARGLPGEWVQGLGEFDGGKSTVTVLRQRRAARPSRVLPPRPAVWRSPQSTGASARRHAHRARSARADSASGRPVRHRPGSPPG